MHSQTNGSSAARHSKRRSAGQWLLANARSIVSHCMVAVAVYTLVSTRSLRDARKGESISPMDGPRTTSQLRNLLQSGASPPLQQPASHADDGEFNVGITSDSPVVIAAAAAATAADHSADADAEDELGVSQRTQWALRKAHPWHTDQLCYMLPDDSEFCEYDGPICYAGGSQIVVLSNSPAESMDRNDDGRGAACADYRWWEPSDSCGYSFVGGKRSEVPSWTGLDAAARMTAAARADLPPTSMRSTGRLWGPHGRFLGVGHMHPRVVIDATDADTLQSLGNEWAATAAAARASEPLKSRYVGPLPVISPPDSVTWLEGNTYFVYMSHDGFPHPWHFDIATKQMWAIKRMNSTVQSGGEGGNFNFTVGSPGWSTRRRRSGRRQRSSLPLTAASTTQDRSGSSAISSTHDGSSSGGGGFLPIDNLVMPALYSTIASVDSMPSWTKQSLRLSVQPHTRLILPRELNTSNLAINGSRWLCSKTGVLIGGS